MGATNSQASRREWAGLLVIALPCVLYSMDLTVLNLALPSISAELGPTSTQTLWILDIYGFLVAGCLITMGNLGDRIGRRRLLLIGASAFGMASLLAACAKSPSLLIAARALLGVTGATLAPSTLSLIRNMFRDPRERTIAIGVWTTSFSLGSTIGPLLGGVMLARFGWGSVFLLAVPVMLLLVVLGPRLLPEFRDDAAGPIDPFSALSSLLAILALIYGLKLWAAGGKPVETVAAVCVGLSLGIVFIRRQLGLTEPLIDVQLFRQPGFTVPLVTYTLISAAGLGSYVLCAQYLQLVLGFSPLRAGLWTLPGSIAVTVGSMLAPAIVRRTRPSIVMAGGFGLAAGGFIVLSQVGSLGLTALAVGTSVIFLGMGPVVTLGTDLVMGAAPPERAGAAAGLSETSAELGGALGIAVLGSLATAAYRGAMHEAMLPQLSASARVAARDTLSGALRVASELSPEQAAALVHDARAAFTEALQLAAASCAALAVAAAILAAYALRRLAVASQLTTPDAGDTRPSASFRAVQAADRPSYTHP